MGKKNVRIMKLKKIGKQINKLQQNNLLINELNDCEKNKKKLEK